MKTSILVSSFAALCLLLTFAEAPLRRGGDEMNAAYTTHSSIPTIESVTMLPGVFITAERKMVNAVSVPAIPAVDFSYLKFDVADFKNESADLIEATVLTAATAIDFSYLKFNSSNFISEFNIEEITELPVNENNTSVASVSVPVANALEYLLFDVNDYINSNYPETEGIGELPLEESKSAAGVATIVRDNTLTEFSYLKFDVTKYYRPENISSDEQYELPEK